MNKEEKLENYLRMLNTEIIVTTESGYFERSEVIPFIRFLFQNVLKNENDYLYFSRLDKYLKDMETFTGNNDGANPELVERVADYNGFTLIKEDGKFQYLSEKAKLEITLVNEGLLIKKGMGNNTELLEKVIGYIGSWGKYNLKY